MFHEALGHSMYIFLYCMVTGSDCKDAHCLFCFYPNKIQLNSNDLSGTAWVPQTLKSPLQCSTNVRTHISW